MTGCFSRLPGRMEDKVFLLIDELQYLLEVDPFQRRETIVVITVHRPFCVEKSFLRHLISLIQPGCADLSGFTLKEQRTTFPMMIHCKTGRPLSRHRQD